MAALIETITWNWQTHSATPTRCLIVHNNLYDHSNTDSSNNT